MENNYTNEDKKFLQRLIDEHPTYSQMVEFCSENIILNNYIVPELAQKGYLFDTYCGKGETYYNEEGEEITREEYEEQEDCGAYSQYDDIYQYCIVDSPDRFEQYTNELLIYNEELDLYILCVKHLGTSWDYVSANWKNPEDIKELD